MKIGILTQPLHVNYGGLLQAYALQTILKRMGHDPYIVQRISPQRSRLKNTIYSLAKIILGYKPWYLLNWTESEYIEKDIRIFKYKYIYPVTPKLQSTSELSARTLTDDYEAFIVGSDQVWRPKYSPCITNYFLDFAEKREVKRIAYAASFGVDDWEFTQKDTEVCANLLKKFDAVSVREISAVKLCREYFGVEAQHLVDPTMLLEISDYKTLVESEKEPVCNGDLFYYVLDASMDKIAVQTKIVNQLGLKPFISMPKKNLTRENIRSDIEVCVYPRVTQWLRSFIDARMVLTDSFHGCVFSIIFNKPFWVIGNKDRGMTRFNSLLEMYGLENRLISIEDINNIDFSENIEWESINRKRAEQKQRSLNFLTNNLKYE